MAAANHYYNNPPFLDTPGQSRLPRLGPSIMSQQPQANSSNNINGNGALMNGMPMMAGQQMDVNFLYQKIVELSDVLRENREKTQGIVNGAEELATRAAADGASPSLQEANAEVTTSRITELERRLALEQKKVRTLIQEQKENAALIGEWETEVGKLVAKVRDHTFDNKAELHAQARHYNSLLQEEKDAHLQARMESDKWHSKFMRSSAMMREAYRLRCEEEEGPLRIVSGLQNEVRALRSALGMEAEKPEDENGWEILKDVPGALGKEEAG